MRIDVNGLSNPEKLLFSHGVVSPDRIDLEAIAAAQGVGIVRRYLDGCEARLVRVGERGIISLNTATGNTGRQRFSLAHELAHWIQDRGRTAFVCSSDDISAHDDGARSIEISANAYASQLVLPDYLVRPKIGGRPASLSQADVLREEFDTSLTSAAIKIVRLTREPACILVHRSGARRWFIRSATFPYEFYVLPELHAETESFTMSFSGGRGMTNPRRCPADRWVSGPDIRRRTVEYQSVGLGGGEVLTLFRLV